MAEVKRYCLCGGASTATGSAMLVDGIAEAFDTLHRGEGHGPASPAQARAARRRGDTEAVAVQEPVLTAVELRTVRLVATGAHHEDVAAALGVVRATVDTRLYRISQRLGTGNAVGTVVECLRRGWLKLDELGPAGVT